MIDFEELPPLGRIFHQRCRHWAETNKVMDDEHVDQVIAMLLRGSGASITAFNQQTGDQVRLQFESIRHFLRFLKGPPPPAVQARFFSLMMRRSAALMRERGTRLAVANEAVFCVHGHPVGRIRHHVPVSMGYVRETAVAARTPRGESKWQDGPGVCSYCGTNQVRQPDGAWYLADFFVGRQVH